jgi:hypothetical protein
MPTPTPNNSGGAFTTVRPGDKLRISAREKNAWNAVARDFQQHQFDSRDNGQAAPDDGVSLLVKNTTGDDLNQFSIVGISGILFSPTDNLDGFKNGPVLKGVNPAVPDHDNRFAVLLSPAKDGTLALAKFAGPCILKVNVTDAAHLYAKVYPGDTTKLISHPTLGIPILYKESGTGTKWAVVLLGGAAANQLPTPTAKNQVLISKEDPDNPGQFIWEANWDRWRGP